MKIAPHIQGSIGGRLTGPTGIKEIQADAARRRAGIPVRPLAGSLAADNAKLRAENASLREQLQNARADKAAADRDYNAVIKMLRRRNPASKAPAEQSTVPGSEFAARLGLTWTSFQQAVGTGLFPKPTVSDGKGNDLWPESVVAATVARRGQGK